MGFKGYFQKTFKYVMCQNKIKTKQLLGFIASWFFRFLNVIELEWNKMKTNFCLQPNNQKPRGRKMEYMYIKLTVVVLVF